MAKTYALSTWFKVFCWIFGICCIVFVFTIPFGAVMLWIVLKARFTTTEVGFEARWLGTNRIAWSEVTALEWARGGGLIGGLMRPLRYTLKNGKTGNIAVGTFAENALLLEEVQRRTGLSVQR